MGLERTNHAFPTFPRTRVLESICQLFATHGLGWETAFVGLALLGARECFFCTGSRAADSEPSTVGDCSESPSSTGFGPLRLGLQWHWLETLAVAEEMIQESQAAISLNTTVNYAALAQITQLRTE